MNRLSISLVTFVAAVSGVAVAAGANTINTGSAIGVYQTRFCPLLQKALTKAQLNYTCAASDGSIENIKRVAADPRQIGYAQLDVFTQEKAKRGSKDTLTVIRADDVRECLFLVTRSKQFSSYGDVAAYAGKLRFILPPENSGSAATFRLLQQIDADGLGQGKAITYAKSTEDAVKQALSGEDTFALFVQLADPATPVFKTINDLAGTMIPVIDRNILRQQLDGQKLYFAEETEIKNAKWVKSGAKVITACTPTVLFTGDPARVTDDKARQDHKDMIATVKALKSEELVPQQSFFAKMLKRTKELSAQSAETLMDLSDKARKASGPAIEKAKEASGKAMEAAKPYVDKAKEAAKDAMDKAKESMGQGGVAGGGGSGGQTPAPGTPAPQSPPASKP